MVATSFTWYSLDFYNYYASIFSCTSVPLLRLRPKRWVNISRKGTLTVIQSQLYFFLVQLLLITNLILLMSLHYPYDRQLDTAICMHHWHHTVTHAHTHTHVHTHIHTHAHTHTCAHTYTHTRTHTHVCTHIYTHTRTHVHIHTYAHTHTHDMCRHMRTHTQHTHTCACEFFIYSNPYLIAVCGFNNIFVLYSATYNTMMSNFSKYACSMEFR